MVLVEDIARLGGERDAKGANGFESGS